MQSYLPNKALLSGLIISLFAMPVSAVTLDDVLSTRKSIVQYEYKKEEAEASREQNLSRIQTLKEKISEVDVELEKVKTAIAKNEKGMSDFPEFAANFQPKIAALIQTKAKLLGQKKEYQRSISDLTDENSSLASEVDSYGIKAANSDKKLKKLKQSYLEGQVADKISEAEEGILVTETQQTTCSFVEIFGKHKGDKQVCMKRAIEQAKRQAAEKYAPTTITSEIESRDFQITSESSQQYYSVDVSIEKEFKNDSWVKMEADAERFRAQFKAKIRVTPAFTKKTRQMLMERFAVKLSGEVARVASVEKRNTIKAAQQRIEEEERAKASDRHAAMELELLRREIEALKKAQSAQQIEQQKQNQALAKQAEEAKRTAEEARIRAEVQRRVKYEEQKVNAAAEEIAEQEQAEVFVPPVF